MFVERVPARFPSVYVPNPDAQYQFVCRLHNKALASSDARFAGRFERQFYQTQANVIFLNRNGWRKTYPSNLGKACSSDATCGAGLACESASKTCKVAFNAACAGPADDTKCATGLCSLINTTKCLIRGQGNLYTGAHCNSNADCDSNDCMPASKRCNTKANGLPCGIPAECTSRWCNADSYTCKDPPRLDGAACTIDEECSSQYCDWETRKCGLQRNNGATCQADSDCVVGQCDSTASPKRCGFAAGTACNADIDCSSQLCAGIPKACVAT